MEDERERQLDRRVESSREGGRESRETHLHERLVPAVEPLEHDLLGRSRRPVLGEADRVADVRRDDVERLVRLDRVGDDVRVGTCTGRTSSDQPRVADG